MVKCRWISILFELFWPFFSWLESNNPSAPLSYFTAHCGQKGWLPLVYTDRKSTDRQTDPITAAHCDEQHTWEEEVGLTPVALVLVAAHTVVVARHAAHLLLHAVRLGRAVFVAAILKADNRPTTVQFFFFFQTVTHSLTQSRPLCYQGEKKTTNKNEARPPLR